MTKSMIAICVDQDRWWVVRHPKGYCAWEGGSTKGIVMFTPTRESASRFSSARLARHFLRSLAESAAPIAKSGLCVRRVTRRKSSRDDAPPPRIFCQTGTAVLMIPRPRSPHAGVAFPDERVQAAVSEMVRQRGVRAIASTLGVSRKAIVRMAQGASVRAATIDFVENRLADLSEEAERSGAAVLA